MDKLNLTYPITGLQINQHKLIEDCNTLFAENSRLTKALSGAMEEIDEMRRWEIRQVGFEMFENTLIEVALQKVLDILNKHFQLKEGEK